MEAVHELRSEREALHRELVSAKTAVTTLANGETVALTSRNNSRDNSRSGSRRGSRDLKAGATAVTAVTAEDVSLVGELKARLSEALHNLAKERAARAAAEATDVGDVYAAYQSDRASLTHALELLQVKEAA